MKSPVVLALLGFLALAGCAREGEPPRPTAAAGGVRFGDNLWLRYGTDVGDPKLGFRLFRHELLAAFRARVERGRSGCRVWLFGDGRAAIESHGGHVLLAPSCNEDLDALFETAREAGIELYPVLLDHRMWDERDTDPGGARVGEHADVIADPSLRKELVAKLAAVVRSCQERFADVIGWWDLANEPCNGTAFTEHADDFRALTSFLADLAGEVLSTSEARISIGFRDRATLFGWRHWLHALRRDYERKTGRKDFARRFVLQFHYYRRHEHDGATRLAGFHGSRLLSDMQLPAAQVCLGEMDTVAPQEGEPRLSPADLRDAGFAYVLYWQDPSGNFPPPPDTQGPLAGPSARPRPPSVEAQAERKQDFGAELACAEEGGGKRRLSGTTPASGADALHWLGAASSQEVTGKVVSIQVHVEQGLPAHRPGWYVHLLLVDQGGHGWIGPGELLPASGRSVRLWAAPVRRPVEVYPDDAQVDLSRVARMGLWLVPGYPARRGLRVDIAVDPPVVSDGGGVAAARRHGLDVVAAPEAGVRPCRAVSLLQDGGTWTEETYTDSRAMTNPRLEHGRLLVDVALRRPDEHLSQGEMRLDLASLQIPVADKAGQETLATGGSVDLRGTVVRFHVRSRGPSDPLVQYYSLAVSNAAFERVDMPGEVKLVPGYGGWVQFWIPAAPAAPALANVASRASLVRLKAALESDGRWQGLVVVDRAEVVPVTDSSLAGNLLARPFCSLQVETWGTDRGIALVEVADGKAVFQADIRPGSKDRPSGRIVYDVRQNSSELGGVDLSKAAILIEADWKGKGDPGYYVQLGLEDSRGRFGSLPLRWMARRSQPLICDLQHSAVQTRLGAHAPDLKSIVKLFLKIGPGQGCQRSLQGTFAILTWSIESAGAGAARSGPPRP